MGPYGRLAIVTVVGVFLDQSSKWLIFKSLENYQKWELTFFLSLELSLNKGGVFGIVQGANYIFIGVSILALFLLIWVYEISDKARLSITLSIGCILAGAIGNLMDRIRYQCVRDFIDLHIGAWHWPTFNLADVFICIGVGLMIWDTLIPKHLRESLRPA